MNKFLIGSYTLAKFFIRSFDWNDFKDVIKKIIQDPQNIYIYSNDISI